MYVITHKIETVLAGLGGPIIHKPLDLELVWNSEDPIAVLMNITDPVREEVIPWLIDRSLLLGGATSTKIVGVGDVKIGWRPDTNVMVVHLTSDEGNADLMLNVTQVLAFLKVTTDIVKIGEEDVETELDQFLKEVSEE